MNSSKKKTNLPISLPCLRGKMGDWYYYVTLLKFGEVANRVSLPKEIDSYYKNKEELKLGDWIQRDLEPNRTRNIVDYLKRQSQHFFNSLILGIYEGNPSWQDISVNTNKEYNDLDDNNLDYLSRTFGILNLEGTEDIFAIDGQHRAIGIREAVKEDAKLRDDEITAIFVAHKTTVEGKIRTRRLFSTLNRYAKPVSQSEIIALSEDNNCAIITRELIENFPLFKDKILINKNRSIAIENKNHFTNIMVLYDIVERLLTNKPVYGMQVEGYDKNNYITTRIDDGKLKKDIKICQKHIKELFTSIHCLKRFFTTGNIDRKLATTSLLFRPIGQNILFDAYKLSLKFQKEKDIILFFNKNTFNVKNKHWKKVFFDKKTGTILTEKSRQRYATLLILEAIGIPIKRTKKDIETYQNFGIKPSDILK
jgi:hypothetical protein